MSRQIQEKERVTIIGTSDLQVENKKLFHFGRFGIGLTFLVSGILILTGHFSRSDDLKSYYNFWQHVSPQTYGGRDAAHELENFQQQSMFEFQRFVVILSYIMGGALIMANNQYGCLLTMIAFSYYALIHWNPLIEDSQHLEQQSWEDAVRYLGVMGSLIFVLTRGHFRDDDDFKYVPAAGGVGHRKIKTG